MDTFWLFRRDSDLLAVLSKRGERKPFVDSMT